MLKSSNIVHVKKQLTPRGDFGWVNLIEVEDSIFGFLHSMSCERYGEQTNMFLGHLIGLGHELKQNVGCAQCVAILAIDMGTCS